MPGHSETRTSKRIRPRDEKGHLARELTDEKIITVLTEVYKTPHQVADALKCSLSGAQKALKRMYQEEKIGGANLANRWFYFLKR